MGSQYNDGSLGPLSSSFTPVLKGSQDAVGADNGDDDDLVPISVAVRICPLSTKKQEEPSCIWLGSGGANDGNTILRCCGPSGEQHAFQFSSVYAEDADQKMIFQQSLEPLLSVLMQGYDVCVIAYGQTGTGKSFTLSGPELDSQLEVSESQYGLVLRSIRYIFQSLTPPNATGPVFSDDDENSIDASIYKESVRDLILKVSFVKVDNQGVRDLLSDYGGKLSYKRHPDGVGIVLEGLKEVECNSTEEVWSLYQMGRKIFNGHSGMNPQQRGHTIFTLDLTILEKNCRKKSSLRFVELVPSDLLMLTNPTRSSVLQEKFSQGPCPQLSVNQGTPSVDIGLLSLDGVVAALGDPRTKVSHPQFSNSLLTSLIRNAFGGPCVTLAVCCVSPSIYDSKQTLDTLTFAWRMSNIQNKPLPNVEPINIRQSMEEEINDLLQANLNGSRRPSGMSELRSISATGGRMPDLVNNANIFPQYPINNNSIWMNQDSLPQLWHQQVNFQPQLLPQHYQLQQHWLQQQLLAQQALMQQQLPFQPIFPGFPQTGCHDPGVLNQIMFQHQLALESRNRHQMQSPFVPINAVSPMPEDVSPLSKQASPLPVSLYLQSNFGIHQQSSPLPKNPANVDSEKVLNPELDPVSLPVNLVPQIDEDDFQADRKKKPEARRLSLASQLKLTKILEESECEVSTPSANSSKLKGSTTPQKSGDHHDSNDVDESGNSDIETNDSSEDFDSECSVCSDFEPTVENLISKFEEETLKIVSAQENQYFDLGLQMSRHELKDESEKVIEKSTEIEKCTKKELETRKSSSQQIQELYQNVLAKQTLLDGMLSRDLELSSARRHLQTFARNLSEETTHIEQVLMEAEKHLQSQNSMEEKREVAELHSAINTLRDKIKTVTGEDMNVIGSDYSSSLAYQHLQERLQLEESNKAFLFAELKQGKQIIDKLQNQLLNQEEHARLSLQMSQELNQQKERLAMEEARLEQVRLETESLQKSLLLHQAELENRSKNLAKVNQRHSPDDPERNEDDIRREVEIFRKIRRSLVEEKQFLEHFLSHAGNLSHCKYCQSGVPRDTSGNRDSSQSKRAIEIDCLIETVDCIIDFKSDILCGRNIDYTNNTDHPENAIMNMLCKLPLAECRALLHKFVLRCVDLRLDGAKHDDKVEQLLWELGVCHVNDQDLRDQMTTMKFEYERQLEIQKREHKKKEALMSKCFKEQDQRKVEDQSVRHREPRERKHRERRAIGVHLGKTNERAVPGDRKPSDTCSSELGAPDPSRLKNFQKLVQLSHAQTERSKVTHSGKKLIIEQP